MLRATLCVCLLLALFLSVDSVRITPIASSEVPKGFIEPEYVMDHGDSTQSSKDDHAANDQRKDDTDAATKKSKDEDSENSEEYSVPGYSTEASDAELDGLKDEKDEADVKDEAQDFKTNAVGDVVDEGKDVKDESQDFKTGSVGDVTDEELEELSSSAPRRRH